MKQSDTSRPVVGFARKVFIRLIEDVRLKHYLFIFLGVVVLFAAAYYFLTPFSEGIAAQCQPGTALSFWNVTYFSVVTISSLGYGDLYPIGTSRVLAGIEVLIGLILMGIMLAKLTSFRLAYHVSKLYGSELQKRLEKFAVDFENYEQRLKKVMKDLGESFREIPGHPLTMEEPTGMLEFSALLTQLHARCSDLNDYIHQESEQGAFFANAPRVTLVRAAENLDESIHMLGQVISGLPARGRAAILDSHNRRRVNEITAKLSSLCNHVERNSKDQIVLGQFRSIRTICDSIPASLFATPEIAAGLDQPDQYIKVKDEPESKSHDEPGEVA